jgi:hypothetical protein
MRALRRAGNISDAPGAPGQVFINLLRLGNILPPGNLYMVIEVSGTGVADISGDLLEDFPAPLSLNEASPSVVHDNQCFNCGALPAGLGPNNVTLAKRPADPSKPARIAW